jgi:hypothetical protein
VSGNVALSPTKKEGYARTAAMPSVEMV